MINYLGEQVLGSFFNGNTIQKTPSKPFDTYDEPYIGCGLGDVSSFNISDLNIGDTPNDPNNALNWHIFEVDGNTLYVCDRVILNGNTINNYESSSYLNGEFVTIDGKNYLARMLTPDEWEKFLVNEDRIFGVPVYTSIGEIDPTIDDIKQFGNHNVFWNWLGMGTVLSNGSVKGYFAPDYDFNAPDLIYAYGYRPVLEPLKEYPIINGDEGRLGLYSEPFTYKYDVTTYVNNDTVTIKEKLNGEVINTITRYGVGMVHEGSIDLNPYWIILGGGTHTIEIEATNKNGIITTKVVMFNTPTITYVHHEGLEYFASKLWDSKIKPFVTEMGKRQGGLVLDSSESYTGVGTFENTTQADNGKCIKTNINGNANILACFSTDAIKLGRHGISLRVSVNNRVNANTFELGVYKKNGSTRSLISKKTFKSSDLTAVNKFENLYMSFNYDGDKLAGQTLEFELKTLSCSTSHVLKLDYILVSPILPTVFS